MNQPHDPNQQWGQQPPAGQPWGQQPQQYDAPQGAQPWGQAPQKSGNGKLIALIGGGVALLAIIGLVLWLVLSGGGRSAEDTVTAFMDAAKKGDVSAAQAVSCPAVDKQVSEYGSSDGWADEYEVKSVSEHGDTASAAVTVTDYHGTLDVELALKKNSDGDFEVCGIKSNGD